MPVRGSGGTTQALAWAILLEATLLAGAMVVLAHAAQSRPALSEPVAISLVNEETPPPPPEPAKPKPVQPKARLAPAPTPPLPAPPVPAALPTVEAPTAFSEPVTPPPPPAPQLQKAKIDPGLEYAVKVRAAVQAAVFYPPAAAALRFVGRVRLEFHLRDAVAGVPQVLVASGIGLIDRAALQAVSAARYPEPPLELRGVDRVYQVWVEFNR